MRPDQDSLNQVELVLALENELGVGEVGGFPPDEAAALQRIVCWPYHVLWGAPEPQPDWPATVRVVGEDGRRVLFLTGRGNHIGVGCRDANGTIDAIRVYPSLRRALFAFARLECEAQE